MLAIKCIVINYTYKLLFVLTATVVLLGAYIMEVLEGPINEIDMDSIDFTIYSNCIWFILVTMTTSNNYIESSVGYSDYTPKTNLGRLLAISYAIFGAVIVSIIVYTLTNHFRLNDKEDKVY